MTEDALPDFAVILDQDRRRIEAWSTRRLPFEPRGSMLAFRSELRSALSRLDASTGRLHCIYGSRSAELCDAENILLYNVGVSAFSAVAREAVTFERSFDLPACPVPLAGPAEHYHLYAADCEGLFLSWRAAACVASFGGRVPTRTEKVADWWWSMHSSLMEAADTSLVGQPFGLRIRLGTTSRSLMGLLKPLVDGVVAGFHQDTAPDAVVVSRLAQHLATSPEAVKAKLSPAHPLLGQRRLVWPYRDGVQWNPADELCVACRVELDRHLSPGSFEGELLRVSVHPI